jgi:glycosyltransferase involved in cell wall biosynthesis
VKVAIVNFTGGMLSGGYRKYLESLLPLLVNNPHVEALLVANPSSLDAVAWHDNIPGIEWVGFSPILSRFGRLDTKARSRIRQFKPDVIFFPTARIFQLGSIPIVAMVQNMEALAPRFGPYPFLEDFKLKLLARATLTAARKADRVIAVSHFVRDYLYKKMGVPEEKISVVYYGADMSDSSNNDAIRPDMLTGPQKDDLLFTAGPIRPYKGFEDAIGAMGHLAKQGENGLSLVIAGHVSPQMSGYKKRLERLADKEGVSDKVIWLGHLNPHEMNWCFKNCKVFLMTSRVESFGLVMLEAMLHGCMIVSADNPCLPEIMGDAAVFYPPGSKKLLADAVRSVLSWPPEQRKAASDRAKKRVLQFSWDITAERTVQELARAAK